jgi:IclR family pca regulon transcriptional regulator
VLLAGQGEEWLREHARSFALRRHTERTITKRAAFAAELARVGEQGYALVDQELEDGLRALAVPIRDGHDRVLAAVNVAVHASRWPIDRIRGELLPRLRTLAAAVERDVRATD